ncbi:unnamed protein product [Blepharisma stoltei]|uniref:Uncharacterized protein n=1 Tax=Blepharisma stoltei TaxID=1481888 RepID=A0AAU9IBY0_9CILI|nr:unnamed protein product [Blepharisma stoltei]
MSSTSYIISKHIIDPIPSTPCSALSNSYLQETEYNSDIDNSIRNEIEDKFSKSKINQTYVFPRLKPPITLQGKFTRATSKHHSLISETEKNNSRLELSSKKKLLIYKTYSDQNKSHLRMKSLSLIKADLISNPRHKRVESDITSYPSKFLKSPYLRSPRKLPKLKSLIKKNLTHMRIKGNLPTKEA